MDFLNDYYSLMDDYYEIYNTYGDKTQTSYHSAVVIPPTERLESTIRGNQEQTYPAPEPIKQKFLEKMTQSEVANLQANPIPPMTPTPAEINAMIPGPQAYNPNLTLTINGKKYYVLGKLKREVYQSVLASENNDLSDPQFTRENVVHNIGMNSSTASAVTHPMLEAQEMQHTAFELSLPFDIGPVQQSSVVSATELGYNQDIQLLLSQCLASNSQSLFYQQVASNSTQNVMILDNYGQYAFSFPENNHGSGQGSDASVASTSWHLDQPHEKMFLSSVDQKETHSSQQTFENSRNLDKSSSISDEYHTPHSTRNIRSKKKTQFAYDNPLDCPICNRQFAAKVGLSHHIRYVHGGPMDHRCSKCGKQYATEKELVKHELNHDESTKQFMCPKCPRRYRYKVDLVRHLSTKHGAPVGNVFECRYCGKLNVRLDHKLRHEATCKIKFERNAIN